MSNRPRPQRLGHVVLNVRDLEASVRFYRDIVGLEVSDYIGDQMAFLRCTEEHHNLALARIPADAPHRDDLYVPGRPGLEHFSFRLGSLQEIEAAAEMIKAAGIEIVRGIGKHGPGENLFLVFKDPDGNYVEFYAEMVEITANQPYTPRVWENNLDAFDQWHFRRFLVPPPEWGPKQ
jgi:catechol 2,3-dioxygenase-like lactoylglutathione lyase family enzyme